MNITDTVRNALMPLGAFSIGDSVCGNEILCVHRGSFCGEQIIVTAAIHARECFTSLVVIEQARVFDGRDFGAYFIPLVNPDGAAFFERGETFGYPFLADNSDKRTVWKANADGVDLNCNFDANFGTGEHNRFVRGASDYVGAKPMSAPETRALASFTESVRPSMTVSYHCMGGELYWEFFQTGEARVRDEAIAKAIAARIGVKKVDGDLKSAGGYKDWCVSKLGIPAVTIELIKSGEHPFGASDFERDIRINAHLPEYIAQLLRRDKWKNIRNATKSS